MLQGLKGEVDTVYIGNPLAIKPDSIRIRGQAAPTHRVDAFHADGEAHSHYKCIDIRGSRWVERRTKQRRPLSNPLATLLRR